MASRRFALLEDFEISESITSGAMLAAKRSTWTIYGMLKASYLDSVSPTSTSVTVVATRIIESSVKKVDDLDLYLAECST